MTEIPAPVLQYLSTTDAMVKAQIVDRYPDLQQQLASPMTKAAVLSWLKSDNAWEPSAAALVSNCLGFLRGGAAEEAQAARPFVLHPDPFVRNAAFEFLLALYDPNKNPEAVLLLCQSMLSDSDDKVRSLGAHYIATIQGKGELKDFLERWLKNARALGWEGTESFERIENILKK